MAQHDVLIFAADNLTNPQNPGFLPSEDATFMSSLVNGDTITWNGGGESSLVTIDDPADADFDEALANQTLVNPVTFDGVSYASGQVVTPTYTIIFSGSDGGTYTMTSFNFSPNTNNEIPDAVFFEGNLPPPGTVLTVTAEVNPTGANARDYNDFVTCFCEGTLIETKQGLKPVEKLTKSDQVLTHRGVYEDVLMIADRLVTADELAGHPKLRPIKITEGALGLGLPMQDTWFSRQHRLKVASPVCERMFGKSDVLVAAIHLTQMPGIYIDEGRTNVRYFHILLASHEVIFANGAPAESLYLGEEALASMTLEARDEIQTLFPEIFGSVQSPSQAMHIPSGQRQKRLVSRLKRNHKPLLV